ncbi:MAG: aldose 1-epimerase [Microbacteriaceae bacterium]|jgi:aldose 1-epimerase|nr:aldose 1-epimerase [Microbacteriaceae bacterium]
MRAPTGEQFELTRQARGQVSRAVITEVAAALRVFTVDGIDLVEPYPESSTPPSAAGIVLVPWPNRVKDGAWQLNGAKQQLDLTEPARLNAIHGLLRHSSYHIGERSDGAITLTATVFPQSGYPFLLDTSVRYELVDDGLHVTHTITNASDTDAPVAVGTHPYFKIGDVPTGDLTLTLSAATHFEVDERLNVLAEHPVDGTPYDLRGGVLVRDLHVDDGWGGVAIANGESSQTLMAADGRTVSMWADEHFGYVQVYTSRNLATETTSEVAIAIEPMTAPTNAFNSGRDVQWLAPGDTWTVRWGIRHAGFASAN